MLKIMKTKSANKSLAEIGNADKVNDFLKYYKSSADNNINVEEGRTSTNKNDESNDSPDLAKRLPRNKLAKKKVQGKIISLSKIDINGPNLASITDKLSPLNDSKVTSTPIAKINKDSRIKPIIKDTSIIENVSNVSQKKPKKRNKSVSFMLEDHEEVTVKKTKSDDALITKTRDVVKNKQKKNSKNQVKVKENKENDDKSSTENCDVKRHEISNNKRKHSGKKSNLSKQDISGVDHEMVGGDATTFNVPKKLKSDQNISGSTNEQHENNEQMKKKRKVKKQKPQVIIDINSETAQDNSSNAEITVPQANSAQKKKRKRVKKQKPHDTTNNEPTDTQKDATNATESENTNEVQKKKNKIRKQKAESAETQKIPNKQKKTKNDKTDSSEKTKKSDVLAKEIENLNIGDNAHTLTNLLNGISVDKNKKNKKKSKNSTEDNSSATTAEESSQKKSKKNKNWKKKRNLNAVVLVQNLPFSILLDYKQVLKEHFSKFGKVHTVGVADLKCEKGEPKPIFTTRVFFTTEEAAASALTENRSLFKGNVISVKKFKTPAARTYKPGAWAKKPFRPHKTKKNEDKKISENNEIEKDFCEKFDHDSDSV